jgi:hypothetical protein
MKRQLAGFMTWPQKFDNGNAGIFSLMSQYGSNMV